MKRRSFLLSGAALLASTGMALAETLKVSSPGDGYLNLRTGPGTRFGIVRQMYHGTTVEVLERAGGWLRVRHESGDVGWASARFLKPYSTPQDWYRVYSPGDGYLNLRAGPGTKFHIIFRMHNSEQVQFLEKRGNWWRVRHEGGTVGWAYRKYLVR